MDSGLTPAERALRSRMAAHLLHAKYDSRDITAPAREAFLSRFEREVDPDGVLPPAERQRRADQLRKAYFTRLALESAKARRRRRTRPATAALRLPPWRPPADRRSSALLRQRRSFFGSPPRAICPLPRSTGARRRLPPGKAGGVSITEVAASRAHNLLDARAPQARLGADSRTTLSTVTAHHSAEF